MLRFARKHRLAAAGAVVLVIMCLIAMLAPIVAPHSPTRTSLMNTFAPSSQEHLLGTDDIGRDVFTRILYGGRVTLAVGLAVGLLATALGTVIGLCSGYYGGWADTLLMRFLDFFLCIPGLALLIVLAAVLPPSLINLVIILTLTGWTSAARLVRSVTLTLREREFTEAARALGSSDTRILTLHILRNTVAPLIVAVTLSTTNAIRAEAALSYLGLGIQPPTPSWGNMLMNAQEYFWRAPLLAVWPGLFIVVAVFCLNFLGDGIRDYFDPKSRER